MLRLLPTALIAVLALGALPAAQAKGGTPQRLAVPADLVTTGETTWYGIYFGKTKMGWALKQIGPLQKRGQTFLRSR